MGAVKRVVRVDLKRLTQYFKTPFGNVLQIWIVLGKMGNNIKMLYNIPFFGQRIEMHIGSAIARCVLQIGTSGFLNVNVDVHGYDFK